MEYWSIRSITISWINAEGHSALMSSCSSLNLAEMSNVVLMIQGLHILDAKMFDTINQFHLPDPSNSLCIPYNQPLPGNRDVPLDRHSTLTEFSADEFVIPINVGPKNMTSSSGWAMTKRMFRPWIASDSVRFKACILEISLSFRASTMIWRRGGGERKEWTARIPSPFQLL